MKWLNHEIVTGALVYGFAGGNLHSTLAALAGCLFPDMLEGRPPDVEEKRTKWDAMHRKVSHWFPPYAVIAAIMLASSMSHRIASLLLFERTSPEVLSLIGYFALGSLFHIGEDALCGHAPSLNPNKGIGLQLFPMGSRKEYLFSFSLTALLLVGMLLL